jgi:cysteine desulfurase
MKCNKKVSDFLIYFDNAATTQVIPEVAELIIKYMTTQYGNPSSLHRMGLDAQKAVDHGRSIIAKHLRCKADDIIFTAGGTESNNTIIKSLMGAENPQRGHLITSQAEHASVLSSMAAMESMGFSVTYLPVDHYGRVDCKAVKDAIRKDTRLISLMLVNNELGTLNDIQGIANTIRHAGYSGLIHTDATQAIGKIPIDLSKLNVDYLSLSAHKCHGPKGVGLIYKGTRKGLKPLVHGGGQEKNLRSGTHNVPGIVGMAKAIAVASESLTQSYNVVSSYQHEIIACLNAFSNHMKLFSPIDGMGVPHIISVGFSDIPSEVLLHALESESICVSSGSACSSNKPDDYSHVLKAINAPLPFAKGTIRISLSKLTTHEDVKALIKALNKVIPQLQLPKRS